MMTTALVDTLSRLEAELHQPGVRSNAQRLEQLLHPEFEEVGRSGRRWSRNAIIDMMLGETAAAEVVADAYTAAELQPGVALLTYRSAHRQADGSLARHTLRASLWVREEGGWRIRYHQGTAVAEGW